MIERQIEISSHLRGMKPSLIAILLTLTPCFYFYSLERDKAILLIGLGFVLLFTIPTSIIHWNYYNNDKAKHIAINLTSGFLQINDGEVTHRIDFNDIERVVLTRGAQHSRSIFHKYYYYQLELKDRQVIYLTSLLLHENDFPGQRVKSKISAFPTIEYFADEGIKTFPGEEEIEKFKLKYQSKGDSELEVIISDNRFVEEAKIAATELLNQRLKNAEQLT